MLEYNNNNNNINNRTNLANNRQCLTLIDLAGNENRYDSLLHNIPNSIDTQAINQSLSALQDCIRISANQTNSWIISSL